MGTLLIKDVLYQVSKDLGDIAPQFARWTQKELVMAANDGQRAIFKYLPYSGARVDVIKLVAGTRQSISLILAASVIPGDGSAAADVRGTVLQSVNRNMGLLGAVPGTPIYLEDKKRLNANYPNWNATTAAASGATPTQYTFDPRTPKVFYVNPAVPTQGAAADVRWIEISMLANPTDIPTGGDYTEASASTQVINIDDQFKEDLHNYIMARAHMKDAESQASLEMANVYAQRFTGSINAQAATVSGVNPNLQALPGITRGNK